MQLLGARLALLFLHLSRWRYHVIRQIVLIVIEEGRLSQSLLDDRRRFRHVFCQLSNWITPRLLLEVFMHLLHSLHIQRYTFPIVLLVLSLTCERV